MTQISDERRTDRELSDMIQSLLNHGEAGYIYVKIDTHLSALRELQSLRASMPGGAEVQCCMCGKTGLSTIEGDGGTECQLEDGRWTCSQDCYYTAVDWFSRPALAEQYGEPDAYIDWKTQCAWPAENIKDPTGLQPVWYAAPTNPVISDDMVESVAEALCRSSGTGWEFTQAKGHWREKARAALSVKPQSGSRSIG